MMIEGEVVEMSNVELVSELAGKIVSGAVEDDNGLTIQFTDGSRIILNAGFDARDLPILQIETAVIPLDVKPFHPVDHCELPE